ncbi:hypothetical protein [Salinibacillus xinjiangensis]|uniref:Uncharacterized protein n=1 Tax=Salinibacillus xinjiangensis TaxID=1229268 RepID=A0A6G1XA04_9BACI|nr:hypothetical protein [Salinibacillus xinjiangensis]MRG87843.1 hypothetical protein [Salinibacillus xinjiangensis]
MSPATYFVAASIIAAIGITFAFKQLARELEGKIEREETISQGSFQQYLSRFFVKVGLIEAVPIVLVVLGYTQAEETSFDILLPMVAVLLVLFFGLSNVFMIRRSMLSIPSLPNQTKNFIHTLSFIGMSLIGAIPIVSVVAILTLNG